MSPNSRRESSYADDQRLRSRQAIWGYADEPLDPVWRTSAVAWDGTQVAADIGCGNGLDLRQLIAQGKARRVAGIDLSAGMLRSVRDCREPGRASLVQADVQQLPLRDEVADVTLHRHDVALSLPDPQPVISYLNSLREPIQSHVGEQFDFDAALEGVAARITEVVRARGSFQATSQLGVFACR